MEKKYYVLEKTIKEYGEVREQTIEEVYTDNGANEMCQYWCKRGIEEAMEVLKKWSLYHLDETKASMLCSDVNAELKGEFDYLQSLKDKSNRYENRYKQ